MQNNNNNNNNNDNNVSENSLDVKILMKVSELITIGIKKKDQKESIRNNEVIQRQN